MCNFCSLDKHLIHVLKIMKSPCDDNIALSSLRTLWAQFLSDAVRLLQWVDSNFKVRTVRMQMF